MVDVDLSLPPFSLLDAAGREHARRGMDMACFDRDEVILEAGQTGEAVFLIHRGEVAEIDPALHGAGARMGLYLPGDLFGAISILNGQSRYRFIAEQECLCHVLPRMLFQQLCRAYPEFDRYFRQSLGEKTRRLMEQRARGGGITVGFMLDRTSACMRSPRVIEAGTSIEAAVRALNASHADSLLVERGGRFGMLTRTDLLNALVLDGATPEDSVAERASYALISVTPEQYLFEALILMTRHHIARVVVVEAGAPVGVVELPDVLSHFSSRSHVISLQIDQAEGLQELAEVSRRTPELAAALMDQGVKLRLAMELLATLNARVIRKAWQLCIDEPWRSRCCLVVMGSEGRGEQMLKTDQDNAVIFADDPAWPDAGAALQRLIDALVTLGYPLCPGRIMASNPAWQGSVSQWQARIADWAARRDGDSLMQLAIMLDAHPVAGNAALLAPVREALFDHCADDELLVSWLARAALRFSTPLTLFGSLKKPQHGIDIKKGGIFPIVHGVRTMALERRIDATSTFARLDALVADGRLERRFADDVGEALSLFNELRLKRQLGTREASDAERDRVVVQTLSSLERDLLREALHIVRDLKQRLSHRYHLEYS